MKKLHLLLMILFIGVVVSAYGTCYLTQVVCCIRANDNTGSTTHYDAGPWGTCTGNVDLFADEDAYALTTYSVTKAGWGMTASTTVFCDGTAENQAAYNNPDAGALPQSGSGTLPNQGMGFTVYYNVVCNGTTYTPNPTVSAWQGYSYTIGYIGANQHSTCN